ncbi:hypothetical protein TNCV_4966841 [Trichonephila clavipes]|nr:hypothetical protein TNCV_4966841 [Trichonephila clavipes]
MYSNLSDTKYVESYPFMHFIKITVPNVVGYLKLYRRTKTTLELVPHSPNFHTYPIYGQRPMNMNRYTNSELADIHFIYDLVNRNGRVDVRLYGERYTTRWKPNPQMLTRMPQNLAEHGSFRVMINGIPANSEINLMALISIAIATIRETPGSLKHVRQSTMRRCRAFIHANGSNSKDLLRCFNAIFLIYS